MDIKLNPREEYGKKLVEMARLNSRIVAICADVTSSNKFNYFADEFPDRFFNVGIAEQNMVGIAAGMAVDGKIPFVSTFGAFASMRAYEQVRTDVSYVNLPVKIVSTCCGIAGCFLGVTHTSLEDISLMRSMPNMTIISPADPLLCSDLFEQAGNLPGPVYFRLGRGEDAVIYKDGVNPIIGKALPSIDGNDATIIAYGSTVSSAISASELLSSENIHVRVLDMHTIKPLDKEAVIKAAIETGIIITVDDHFITGGLGTAVAEVLAESSICVKFKRLGIPDIFPIIGNSQPISAYYGFDVEGIVATIRDMLS
jgi:transketolase